MVVDRVHPQRLVRPPVERGQEVVPRNPHGQAEAGDRLGDIRERVTAAEADEQGPRRDEEPAPARLRLAVHLAQVGLRALPAFAVGLPVHVPVPARGVPSHPIRLDAIAHEREQAQVPGPQPALVVLAEHAAAVEDPVVQVGLARLEGRGPDGIVEDHSVDHDVGLQAEDGLE